MSVFAKNIFFGNKFLTNIPIIIILMAIDTNIKKVFAASQWQKPYFIESPTQGIQLQTSDAALDIQTINVQEELIVPYKLAKINYNGTIAPSLGAFDIGDNSLLGAKINFTDNQWFITIEKRQDYENSQQRIYFFQIYIKGVLMPSTVEPSIFIKLENIFDNQPTLTYWPSPCRIEELHSNYISDCAFLVYDPDGMDRNNIRIEAKGNDNEIFTFVKYGETSTYEKQYKLKILQELHYEEKAIYNLDVKVYDANNNTGGIFAILEVIDLPNLAPIWVRPLTTATFNEKQEQVFSLKAIDGDTGIDKPICYRLEFGEDYSNLISIGTSTGILHIQPIDRDLLNQQIFNFYTCAYKCDDPLWFIKNSTILIVQDINDHKPKITMEPKIISILETKHSTLPLDKFFVEDMDLGANATYNVFLKKPIGKIIYTEAFTLVPNNGYQLTEFSLSVTDQLDYENENWRTFELEIMAKEIENVLHFNEVSLTIQLINWNDEWPIFERETYEIEIYENATKGTKLIEIQANDRDVGDKIIHSIVGNVQGIIIDPFTGLITLNKSDALDFERQKLVMLQIQAKDTLTTEYNQNLHTSYSQLQIKILDVNDETPELRLPRVIVNITENSAALSLITDKIEARDPDTTANLSFEILWSQSYATKSGQEVNRNHYIECFIIEREIFNNNRNLVNAQLKINNKFMSNLDYEKFDTIFLTIRVRDLNQEINDDSATAVLTVRIDDLNDNPPQFVPGTLEEPRSVTEMENILSTVGTIEAYDIDGAGNNNLSFKIRPMGVFTNNDLISINSTSGVIKVTGLIQCDIPKIYYLEYEVIVSDYLHETKGNFKISVIDINNQVPTLDDFEQQVYIFENTTSGTVVGRIKAYDNDRDSPHNSLEFTINSALQDSHNLFQINSTSGEIKVNLRNSFTLDRDMGIAFHYIPIDIKDNFNFINSGYGPVNQISTFINVTLKDVNDNAPIMPQRNHFKVEFSEADEKNTISKTDFVAKDRDEPNTPNSELTYDILSIKPVGNFNPNVQDYGDFFTIITMQNSIGHIKTQKSLKGYYGLWEIEIEATDHGRPQLRNSSIYDVSVKPYNFHVPRIIFPYKQKFLRICYSLQEPSRPLYHADCITRLKAFEVYDPDGGQYGDVHFEMSSDVGHDKYFKLIKESRNSSNLYLKQLLSAGIYNINLRAIDGGGSTSSEIRNLKIVFVDTLGNPMFLQRFFETDFTENEQGLLEERSIPPAYDPKNEGLDNEDEAYKLFYFIDATFNANDAKLFVLNSETGLLKLNTSLDREAKEELSIRIKVSNSRKGLITNPSSVNYTLIVNITVNDVNDNEPKFKQDIYAAGITTKDSIGKQIIIFEAEDPDKDDVIVFSISHGENLSQSYEMLLTLDHETGILKLNSYVTNKMKGYLKFEIEASDLARHVTRAAVKIYIVSEANRVKFVFLSDIQVIRNNEKFLREQLQEIYGYEICNVDAIEDVTNTRIQKLRQALVTPSTAFITEVKVHFIHNNEAVEAYEIQRRSNDLAFISRLQNLLQQHSLILNDIPHIESEAQTAFADNWLITALVGLNVILGILSALLIALYVVKIRTLKRQLKAFEPAEFGSVASNLNRLAGPSMNIFSVEGSNPVFKKQINEIKEKGGVYDNEMSSDSDDDETDFRDLHDDSLFEMNNVSSFDTHNKKATTHFERKILNNEFFTTNDKLNNREKI